MLHDKKPRPHHDDPFHAPQPAHDAQHAADQGRALQHEGRDAGRGPADEAALTGLFGGMYGADKKAPERGADEVALRSRLNQYFSAWSHYGGTFDASPAIALYRPNASIEDIAPNMEKLVHQRKWQTHYGNAAEYGQAMNHLYNTVKSFTMHWDSSAAKLSPEPGGEAVTTDLSFGATITTKLVPVHMHLRVHAHIRWVKEGGKWVIASETLRREGIKMPGIGPFNSGE